MKIVEIKWVTSEGDKLSSIWVGSESAIEPAELLLLLVQKHSKCEVTISNVNATFTEPQNHFLNENIQRFMNSAGYKWFIPKSITLV